MRAKTEALAVAKQLSLDGVQVSMGNVDNDLQLRRPDLRREYRETAAANGVRIGGVALDIMNQVPYKSDPRTEQWVSDSIDAARDLGVRVVLLAFFEKGDLRNDPAGQAETIRRLARIAPKAEQHGVVLGIESWLSAAEHIRLLDAIGSRSVQVYYDLANSTQMGYDIVSEIRQLGRERICEFHAKENGALLGQGRIDFPAVRKAMDDIGYTGWIQIEGAVPKGQPLMRVTCRTSASCGRISRKLGASRAAQLPNWQLVALIGKHAATGAPFGRPKPGAPIAMGGRRACPCVVTREINRPPAVHPGSSRARRRRETPAPYWPRLGRALGLIVVAASLHIWVVASPNGKRPLEPRRARQSCCRLCRSRRCRELHAC